MCVAELHVLGILRVVRPVTVHLGSSGDLLQAVLLLSNTAHILERRWEGEVNLGRLEQGMLMTVCLENMHVFLLSQLAMNAHSGLESNKSRS